MNEKILETIFLVAIFTSLILGCFYTLGLIVKELFE